MTLLVMRLMPSHPGPPRARALSTIPPPKPLTVPVGPRGKHAVKAPFEALPMELLDQIFELLDLQQLRSLVHASHVFHAYYRQHRIYLLSRCLEASLDSEMLDPAGVPVLADAVWSYHYGGNFRLFESWRITVLRILKSPTCSPREVIDTTTFFFYFVVPLDRSHTAYKEALDAGPDESIDYGSGNDAAGLASPVQRNLEDLATHLRGFYHARNVWRANYGAGSLKRVLRRHKSLYLIPEELRQTDVMVFDDE